MARPYRLQAEHCFYHITSRGNERKDIFRKESDYQKFIGYVLKAKHRYRFYLYAYVLMSNHYHLLIETTEPNLSRIMQYINTSYTTYHNVKYKRSGHLFQGRYKSIVVEKERYFLELTRYIHLNPVRAGIAKRAEEYRWSSYHGYLHRKGDGYIDKDEIKKAMDMNAKAYKEFVVEGTGKSSEPFKGLYGGFILGSVGFIKEALSELKDQVEGMTEVAYKAELSRRFEQEQIIKGVEKKYGKSRDKIIAGRKRPMREKKMLIYLLRKLTALTNQQIGDIVGMRYAAVSMAGRKMEALVANNRAVQKEADGIICTFEV